MIDVFLHVLGSLVFTVTMIKLTTPWLYMAGANALFWLGREMAQHNWNFKWDLEWIAPALTGVIFSYVAHRIFQA